MIFQGNHAIKNNKIIEDSNLYTVLIIQKKMTTNVFHIFLRLPIM
jgi:hypothetical protein